MKNNKLSLKNKIINNLIKNGQKNTSEKIFLKILKEFEKNSNKQSRELIQIGLLNSAPIFKLLKISNKKRKNRVDLELPMFISNTQSRFSIAIKYLIRVADKINITKFHLKLVKEFFASTKGESNTINIKKEIQKKALTRKYFFKYFKNR